MKKKEREGGNPGKRGRGGAMMERKREGIEKK